MAENNKTYQQTVEQKVGHRSLGQYFANNTPTVFDDIISKTADDSTNGAVRGDICDLHSVSQLTSTDLLKNEEESSVHRASSSSLSDFHRDAWIPSERTKNILRTIATSTPGTAVLDKENLTMPGLTLQGDMVDTINEASTHFHGEEESMHRNVLTAADVTQDERGLRNLIHAGCYKAAINLSGRLLAIYGQGYGKMNHPSKHTPHSLQLWYTRLSLLAKLKQIDVLRAESQAFGDLDKPDMYFSFYPEFYGTRRGSMASFAFRLLIAEIPLFYNKFNEAINNFYKILAIIDQILKNLQNSLSEDGGAPVQLHPLEREDSIRLWSVRKSRTLMSIVNCALAAKNFTLATEVLQDLCKIGDWTEDQREILQLAIARVHLFLGDVATAETYFAPRKSAKPTQSPHQLVGKGLMAVAQNSFQEAYNCIKMAAASDPSNIMLLNNMAVCLLYSGQLKAAVQLLENAIVDNPMKNLQESVLLNVSTLYELHTTHCKQCKLQLLKQVNKYNGDATNIRCLKLA